MKLAIAFVIGNGSFLALAEIEEWFTRTFFYRLNRDPRIFFTILWIILFYCFFLTEITALALQVILFEGVVALGCFIGSYFTFFFLMVGGLGVAVQLVLFLLFNELG